MHKFAVFTLVVVGGLLATGARAEPLSPLCKEFQQLLNSPRDKGISRKALDDSLSRGQAESSDDYYFNLDIDGDDINDVVTRGCSPSSTPSDPCSLSIKLSSGGSIQFEVSHFFLVRHRGKIYAVSSELGPSRKRGEGKIFRVGPKSVEEVCSGL